MFAVDKISNCLISKRLTIILFFLCFSCFCILPSSVYAENPCPNSCTVTVQGINSAYKPGETISGTVNYSISNSSQCPSCVQQILIGIVDVNNQGYDVICVYNGSPKACPAESIGNVSFSLTVPSNSGTYNVIMSNYLQRSCSDAIRFFHDSAKVSKIIATIQVSGSDAVTSNIETSSPTVIDILGMWIKQTLPWIPWIIISALLIAMFGVLMWRKRVWNEEGGGRLSSGTEINIVSAITLGLIILTIYIFFQQQFVTYLIVIGVVILIYFGIKAGIFNMDGGSRNGVGGVSGLAEISPIPNGVRDYIAPGGKRLYIYKVFKSKYDATKYVIYMKKKYGNSYAFQKWASKTYEYGVVWGVYSDFR